MKLCNYPCPNHTRYYEIEAIEIPIVYNKYGDHDPNGLLYVLKKDASRIREGALRNFSQEIPQPYEEVKPLVIRANPGEQVVISFSHSLNRALSIHVLGMDYDVQTSDGANVGFNRDTTTKDHIVCTWYAARDPHTGLPSSTTAISYRSEPMRNRMPLTEDHTDSGEDISMSSWVYADPARLCGRPFKNPADSRRSKRNPRFPSPQSPVAPGRRKSGFHHPGLHHTWTPGMLYPGYSPRCRKSDRNHRGCHFPLPSLSSFS